MFCKTKFMLSFSKLSIIYWDAKDSYKVKYQLLLKVKESTALKNLNDSKSL